MRRLSARIDRLELKVNPKPNQHVRWVVSGMVEPANLETSTCRRTLSRAGLLWELVYLDGSDELLSPADIEQFVSRFPIERLA